MDKNLVGGSSNMMILSLLSGRDMYGYEIIRSLEDEILRGETVYTPAELEKLERKLAEYREMLVRLTGP